MGGITLSTASFAHQRGRVRGDAACSIRGAKNAPNGAERHRLPVTAARRVSAEARVKYKDYILPLIFTKRLCDVFDDNAQRVRALKDTEGKLQSAPEGQDKLDRFPAGAGIQRIADTLIGWKEEEKLSCIVHHAAPLHPSAFILHPSRVSPSRYIHTSDAETYRPIAEEIVETAMRDSAFLNPAGKPQSVPEGQDKLKAIEAEARETDKALGQFLKQLGVKPQISMNADLIPNRAVKESLTVQPVAKR
ncbi:MAG: type I restriction-modification system subunit M N-terminal domain-containing protein [Verrucomicrobiales bacterium]